jgi:hypothetical protein
MYSYFPNLFSVYHRCSCSLVADIIISCSNAYYTTNVLQRMRNYFPPFSFLSCRQKFHMQLVYQNETYSWCHVSGSFTVIFFGTTVKMPFLTSHRRGMVDRYEFKFAPQCLLYKQTLNFIKIHSLVSDVKCTGRYTDMTSHLLSFRFLQAFSLPDFPWCVCVKLIW